MQRDVRSWAGPGVALAFGVLYLAFTTRQYYWDGLAFAIMIEHAQSWRELFNVHHLLYNFIGWGEYRLLGGHVRALYLMQWTNCAAGSLLIWLAYRLFRSLGVPAGTSAAYAALVGAAATFWKFSTDANSYILANVFLVSAWLMLRRSVLPAALLHIGAMTMHQLSVLFYPAALALIWQRSRERFWREAISYTMVSAAGTIAIYAVAYRLIPHPEAPTFTGWLTFHARVPFFFKALKSAGWLLLGTGRLFVGGRLVPAAFIAGPAALVLAALGVIEFRRNRARLSSIGTAWPLFAWCGTYLGFLFIWEPYNTFYRLFYLLPLVALGATAAREIGPRAPAWIVAALLCWNFCTYIYPNTRIENNQPLAFALRQRQYWPPGTGIIFSRFVPDLWTISYFNPQVSWIGMEQPDPARVAALSAQFAKDGCRIYLDSTYLGLVGEPAARFSFRPVDAVDQLSRPSMGSRRPK